MLYGFFLLLLPAGLLILLAPGYRRLPAAIFWPLSAIGLGLLAQALRLPSTEGRGYLHWAVGWLALVLGLALGRAGRRPAVALAGLLVALGAGEALYGLAQALGVVEHVGSYARFKGSIATGTYVNQNHYAGLLAMTLPLAVGAVYALWARRDDVRSPRSERLAALWLALLGCALLGLSLLLSRSRSGAVVLLATLLALAVLLAAGGRRRRGAGLSGAAGAVLVGLVLVLGLGVGLEALGERFRPTGQPDRRLPVFRDGLRLVAERPLTGVGPGMFVWRFRPYQTEHTETRWKHAHSDYLETAAEWGIPAALLLWGFVAWRCQRGVALFLSSRRGWRRGLALGGAGAILAILLFSLTDFNLQIPANLAVFGAILGLVWGLETTGRRSRPTGTGRGATSAARLAVVALVALVAVGAAWRVSRQLRGLLVVRAGETVASLERAIRLDPTAPHHHYRLGLHLRDLPAHLDLEAARTHLERAVELNPHQWRYRLELARLYELAGEPEAAAAAFQATLALNPSGVRYRWHVANFHVRQGDLDAALPHFKIALDADPERDRAVLALLAKLGAGTEELRAIWPEGRAARLSLLVRLCAASGAASPVPDPAFLAEEWWRLLEAPEPPTVREGAFYVRWLLDRGSAGEARRAWIGLQRRNGVEEPDFEAGAQRVWNGGFERPPAGTPLDWELPSGPGFRLLLLEGGAVEGRTALRIDFDGSRNLNFSGVRQQLVVEPGRRYALSFAARAAGLDSDQGVVLEVADAAGGATLLATEPFLGTLPWTRYREVFEVPAGADRLWLRLYRRRSDSLRPEISGRFWLDEVAVTPVG